MSTHIAVTSNIEMITDQLDVPVDLQEILTNLEDQGHMFKTEFSTKMMCRVRADTNNEEIRHLPDIFFYMALGLSNNNQSSWVLCGSTMVANDIELTANNEPAMYRINDIIAELSLTPRKDLPQLAIEQNDRLLSLPEDRIIVQVLPLDEHAEQISEFWAVNVLAEISYDMVTTMYELQQQYSTDMDLITNEVPGIIH